MSRARAVRAWCAALAGCAVLAGCAGGPGAAGQGASTPDHVTASDQTDADRRASVRMQLATGYFARGQATTALDEVKLALVAKPEFGAAYNLRGLIYASLGDDPLADESFRRALQINPRDSDAMHNYAWFHCQRQRPADAERLFAQALAQPGYALVPRTMTAQGICQARAGRWADAERTLARAYEMDSGNPVIGVNLAEVLYRRGELERARFYIRRVNAQTEVVNAQTLWLALRVEKRLGNEAGVRDLGGQLAGRFPRSPEALAYEGGRFDD